MSIFQRGRLAPIPGPPAYPPIVTHRYAEHERDAVFARRTLREPPPWSERSDTFVCAEYGRAR